MLGPGPPQSSFPVRSSWRCPESMEGLHFLHLWSYNPLLLPFCWVYVHTYIYIYIHINNCKYIYIHTHIHINIHTYIHIYIYISTSIKIFPFCCFIFTFPSWAIVLLSFGSTAVIRMEFAVWEGSGSTARGWLVVSTPLKNISQLWLFFPIYGSKPPTSYDWITRQIYGLCIWIPGPITFDLNHPPPSIFVHAGSLNPQWLTFPCQSLHYNSDI